MVKSDSKKKLHASDSQTSIADVKINRLMIAFIIGVFAVASMLLVKKNIANEAFFITYLLPVLLVVAVAGTIASIVLLVKRKGVDESRHIFTGANVFGTACVLLLATVYYRLTFDATMVIAWFIAAVVLYFVYNIFAGDFFLYSVLSAAGVLLLKASSISYMTSFSEIISMIYAIAAIVFAVVGIVLAIMLKSSKGKLALGNKKFSVYGPRGGHVFPLIIAAIIIATGGILAIFASAFVIYAVAALIAAYLAIAVVYVIKMM